MANFSYIQSQSESTVPEAYFTRHGIRKEAIVSTAMKACLQLMSLDAPQQREKLVASLKDQIKKLQKDRDKIKTW